MNILIPLFAHFIADFFFQDSKKASQRSWFENWFIHSCVYAIFIMLSLFWFIPIIDTIRAVLIIIFSHSLIELFKNLILNRISKLKDESTNKSYDLLVFFVTQLLHILIIVSVVYPLNGLNDLGKACLNLLLTHLSTGQLSQLGLLVFLFMLSMNPSAVFIKKIFVFFSLQEDAFESKGDLIRSGYIIGILERVIILMLGLYGDLSAIGFVIAAKSLVRFRKLSKEGFAEKYLVGTLLSVAIALVLIAAWNFFK